MEGTVTISLKDYEELKEKAENDRYLKMSARYIELLEKIAGFLDGEKIAEGLFAEIDKELEKWYG